LLVDFVGGYGAKYNEHSVSSCPDVVAAVIVVAATTAAAATRRIRRRQWWCGVFLLFPIVVIARIKRDVVPTNVVCRELSIAAG